MFRRAHPSEHLALTDLAFRSAQQHWGYSDEFMAWEPEAIVVTPEHIAHDLTTVLEEDGRLLGFYVLRSEGPDMVMLRLMIEPDAIGTGCGRRLWDHAVETARARGATALSLIADPNAEPFYQRMGAVTISEFDTEPPMMPGWRLKRMRYEIPSVDQVGDGHADSTGT